MAEEAKPENGLTFQISPDGGKLLATYEPVAQKVPIDTDWVWQALDAQNLSDLFILDDALSNLVKRCAVAADRFTMQIGERRDGTLALTVAPDLMSAYITITSAYGGNAVTSEQILQALQEQKIVSGILHDEIEKAVGEREVLKREIAKGRSPQPGEDSQFISLIPEMRERCPLADDTDNVDYRNLGGIVSVKSGDPLMRRYPATKGTPGENILGTPLPTTDGNDIAFTPNLSGTVFAENDGDLLLAAISGLPVQVDHGIIVEPVINLKNVDLSSGNLHFEGTVNIAGDVKAGMEVKATGDIIIGGVAEAAKIEAGGDIEIKGGVIGQREVRNQKGELNPDISYVHAGGSVTAQFVENACIIAGRDINIREVVMKSELTAGNEVIVGEHGMKKGHIIGGVCRATTLVHAIIAGSPANVSTRIEVGVDPSISEKLSIVKQQLEEKEKRQEETAKTLAYIRDNPAKVDAGMAKLKERVYNIQQAEITELTGRKKSLQKRLELVNNARIEIERTVYFGVHLMVGDKTLLIEDDLESKTFTRGEEGIAY